MDVKYRPEPWQNMGDGMNRITKDALMKLREANESLKRIDGRIRDLDSDGSIHFNPKDQSQKIGELLDSYTTLQKYCGEAGRLVSEHIDKPFLVEMDKFAQKVRDTSILSFETNNRIGSTTTTVLPDAHAGYGSVPQTIKTKKDKITVEDIFRDSPAFDNVLRAEYKELKKQNPDAKLNYEEYKKVVPSTRGFEYKSIEDEQKKLEMVRDIGIGLGIIITTILCPPLGAAAAVVYGGVQIKSGIDGEDWGTHRKLSQEERVGNIIFGGLDAIPVVGAVGKGVKAFKGTSELADLAKLLKFKDGMPGFNPNLGKNVVQSLKENKTLKNALDAMKNTPIPVAVRTVDTGIGMKLPYIESSTVGEVAGKFSKASTAAKDDAYQLAKGSGGVKGTGNREAEVPPAFRQTDFASSYEARLNQTPALENPKVEFEGIRGESKCILKPPPDRQLKQILDEVGIEGIQYKNAVPDFSPTAKAQVEINYMLGGKGTYGGKARRANFVQSDQKLADQINGSPELASQFGMESGKISARDIKKYREKNKLTWHELNDVKTMQLVPTKINSEFGHLGGVGEINAGAFKPGGFANK
ncbi:HNH endonuclease [Bacillus cereus]|uniref:HNH endonuclease n=1 Tax=Bacillus cereus TaxID=1396 RepID=UPI0027D309AB|nr:HNH endonuclease [Bacillus cereus]MCU5604502.1 HNH endonuclease [Bacillus cereus]